ncbi:MAG: CPBP family intramembrane glutamic endopeptidase [Chloroflexota bacterium]
MNVTSSATDHLVGSNYPIRFGKTFLPLFGLGLLGVLSLIPLIMTQLDALPPEMAAMPTPVVILLSLLNPIILLAIAVAVGTLLAHRIGLRSLVAEKVRLGTAVWVNLRPHIPLAFVSGLVFSIIVLGLDQLMNPFANAEMIGEMPNEGNPFAQLLLGLLYGGITEELLLRWGFMSLLAWLGWRVLQRGQGVPRPVLMWAAIILAAILFGVGHLPALAGIVVLTPLLVFRTILLNALGGLLFGWLFWRRNLETAMVAHAAGHVGFFIVNLVVLVIGG